MKTYYIKYILDTGHEHINDGALVKANSSKEAISILKSRICCIANDYYVRGIIEVEEYDHLVFTKALGIVEEGL